MGNGQPKTQKNYFPYMQFRFYVCLLLMLCYFCAASMRANLGMAMVCMVNSSAVATGVSASRPSQAASRLNSSTPKTWLTSSAKTTPKRTTAALPKKSATKSPNNYPPKQCPKAGKLVAIGKGKAGDGGYHGAFTWSEREQSQLFAAIFCGQLLSMWWSGYLADHWVGPKNLLLFGILADSLLSLLTPLLASWSYYAFLVARLAMGFSDGIIYPTITSAGDQWFVPSERSTMFATYSMGSQLADVAALAISSKLCTLEHVLGGWPLIFLTFGSIGLLYCALWAIFFTNDPADSRWTSMGEKAYIKARLASKSQSTPTSVASSSSSSNNDAEGKETQPHKVDEQEVTVTKDGSSQHFAHWVEKVRSVPWTKLARSAPWAKMASSVPWSKMVRSLPLWAAVLTNFGYFFTVAIIQSYLPAYVKEILQLSVQQNGLFSAVPFVVLLVSKLGMGYLSDELKRRQLLSSTGTVRLFQSVGSFGMAACLLALGLFVDCTRPKLALLLLCGMGAAYAAHTSGFLTALLNMSTQHSGTLISLSFTIGTLGSVAAPMFVGFVNQMGSLQEWRLIWCVTAGINFVFGLAFLAFGSADEQAWDNQEESEPKQEKA